jgi:hypothetical protein
MWAAGDAAGSSSSHDPQMERSYGVVWREGSGASVTGKLELLPYALRLEGIDGSQEVPYDWVAAVRVGRSAPDRINGGPSVVVERRCGEPISIAAVTQPGAVGEIAERLTALRFAAQGSGQKTVVEDGEPQEDISFLPTPGPGDSDGGDIF